MATAFAATRPSRRTVAKGTAWAAPALVVGAAAPAAAASPPIITGSVCQLFYGIGAVNNQTHSIYLGVTSSTGVIPKGTTLTWTVNVGCSGGYAMSPTTNYSGTGSWSLSLSVASGTYLGGGSGCGSFTATMTFNANYTTGAGAGGTWCAAALVWNDSYIIWGASPVTVTSNAPTNSTAGAITSGGTGSLAYTLAKRYPSGVNATGRSPHYFTSKSGQQSCYPPVQYSVLASNTGYDNVTCYPTNSNIPTSARCSWGGTSCASSTSGLCTPGTGGVQSGQLVTNYC